MPQRKEDFKKFNAHCRPRKGLAVTAPKLYSTKLVNKICDLVIEGVSTNRICNMKGMPTRKTLGEWLRKYPEFATKYLEAKQIQTYFNVDDIRDIAEECDESSPASVNKARLRVDVLKWEASKMVPKIYGDKQSLEIQEDSSVTEERMAEIVHKVMNKVKKLPVLDVMEENEQT